MLILTRRVRETLMIGDDVAVTILSRERHPSACRDRCAEGNAGAPMGDLSNASVHRGRPVGIDSPGSVRAIRWLWRVACSLFSCCS